jgi:hypothetical protein
MGKKTQKKFLNIDREKRKQRILLYSFTRMSITPLNQEIPRDRLEALLDVTPSCMSFSSRTCALQS